MVRKKSFYDFLRSKKKEDRSLLSRDSGATLTDHREKTAQLLSCFFLFFKENEHLTGKSNMTIEEIEVQVGEMTVSKSPFPSKTNLSLPNNPV